MFSSHKLFESASLVGKRTWRVFVRIGRYDIAIQWLAHFDVFATVPRAVRGVDGSDAVALFEWDVAVPRGVVEF
jgi:GTP cyclohydrolase FolE2